jgi:hypothetical protein
MAAESLAYGSSYFSDHGFEEDEEGGLKPIGMTDEQEIRFSAYHRAHPLFRTTKWAFRGVRASLTGLAASGAIWLATDPGDHKGHSLATDILNTNLVNNDRWIALGMACGAIGSMAVAVVSTNYKNFAIIRQDFMQAEPQYGPPAPSLEDPDHEPASSQ